MSRTAQPRPRRTHRARQRRPTFAKRLRRSALAAFFDPALDRDRDLPHPPVDPGPPFAAAPQRRAGLSDAGKEAAHRSGEHNREPERNKETAEKGERGRRRPELRPSTTAAPLSHRKWDCLTLPELSERRAPRLAIAAHFTLRQSSAYEPISKAAYGIRGNLTVPGEGRPAGSGRPSPFRPQNAVRNEREDRRRVDTRARSGSLEPRAGDVRRVRLLGAGGESRHA